ncbi:YfkD famly protein [Bacillus coahuilensis]|uniref:YfkD famly protein n=1 Tax=Bacillus coahuilensis TaxID=408580 RepID=UPI00075033A3|nr:YfkD famly protein [Bacillus coahuilensis]
MKGVLSVRYILMSLIAYTLALSSPLMTLAEKAEDVKQDEQQNKKDKKQEESKEKTPKQLEIPSAVINVGQDNTYPNPTQDLPYLQPSDLTQELIDSSQVKIENPNLIKLLNESSMNKSPFALGVRATIYLGEWALNYESSETSPNWQYQKINTNYVDNRGGKGNVTISYSQDAQKQVKGDLTAKVPYGDHVKDLMLLKAMKNTGLPLSFETIMGAGTKAAQVYNVPAKKLGYLYAYAPAINEKGKVTYGEVYLTIKGTKRLIVVKNVTSQGIGAWIPIQDHVSFGFHTGDQPR